MLSSFVSTDGQTINVGVERTSTGFIIVANCATPTTVSDVIMEAVRMQLGSYPQEIPETVESHVKIFHWEGDSQLNEATLLGSIGSAVQSTTTKAVSAAPVTPTKGKSLFNRFKFKRRRKGNPMVLFKQYLEGLAYKAAIAIPLINLLVILIFMLVSHSASALSIVWGLMIPTTNLEKIGIPFTVGEDWTLAIWFSYLYWFVRYRRSQKPKEATYGEPDWSRIGQ